MLNTRAVLSPRPSNPVREAAAGGDTLLPGVKAGPLPENATAQCNDGTFSMAFFTDFTTRGYVGLLDWYTVSIALFAAVVLAAHGATYLTLRTTGELRDRASRTRQRLAVPAIVLGMDLLTQFDSVAMDFGHSQVRFDISDPGAQAKRMIKTA